MDSNAWLSHLIFLLLFSLFSLDEFMIQGYNCIYAHATISHKKTP